MAVISTIANKLFNYALEKDFSDKILEEPSRFRVQNNLHETIRSIYIEGGAKHRSGTHKPQSPENIEFIRRIKEFREQNCIERDNPQLKHSAFLQAGFVPVAIITNDAPVVISVTTISGAITGLVAFGPSLSEPAQQYLPQALVAGGGGIVAGFLAPFAILKAGASVMDLGHYATNRRSGKLLPEREVRLRESLEAYLGTAQDESNPVFGYAKTIAEIIERPVLVTPASLRPTFVREYEKAKRHHPRGVYELF
jgi:hypothetical protein